jgi:hypothetical protein
MTTKSNRLSRSSRWPKRLGVFLIAGLLAGVSRGATAQTRPTVLLKEQTMSYGSYLGGNADDQARGVGLLANGEIVVAGLFSNLQTPGAIQVLRPGTGTGNPAALAANPGKLLKLSADGRKVLVDLTVGNRIDDLEVLANKDRLVVSGDFGVAMVKPSTMQVLWSAQLPEAIGNGRSEGGQTRVSIDARGRVIALRAKVLTLFDSNGGVVKKLSIDRDYVNDVVFDAARGQVYVVGFANRRNANDSGNPVQIPFLYAYSSSDLKFRWRTWDYNANLLTPSASAGSAPENNMADCRIYRVIMGGDGKIIVLGESAGGNSVFRWNGKDFTTATRIKYDAYSDTYNSKSPHLLYFAKLDGNNGNVLAGQFAVPRLTSGLANTFRGRDGTLASDAKGNIYIGGISADGIPQRNENRINGVPVARYSPYDMTFLQVSADLQQRIRWTPFGIAPGGGGSLNGIAISNDRAVVVGSASFGNLYTTPGALVMQPFNPAGNDNAQDVYLGILTRINP